jgi:hypothetical protein
MDAREKASEERRTKVESERRQTETIGRAWDARDTWIGKTLEDVGFGPDEKGASPASATVINQNLQWAIDKAIYESLPSYIQKDREELIRAYHTTVPNDTILARAKEIFAEGYADLEARVISAKSKGQAGTPAATLSAGAGGRPDPMAGAKTWTRQQRTNFLVTGDSNRAE